MKRIIEIESIEEVQKLLDDKLMSIDIVYSGIIDLINFVSLLFDRLLTLAICVGFIVYTCKSIFEGNTWRENGIWYIIFVGVVFAVKFLVYIAGKSARAKFWNSFSGCKFNMCKYYFQSLRGFDKLDDWEVRKIWEKDIYPLIHPASITNNKEESNT